MEGSCLSKKKSPSLEEKGESQLPTAKMPNLAQPVLQGVKEAPSADHIRDPMVAISR